MTRLRFVVLLAVVLTLRSTSAGAQMHDFNQRDRQRGEIMLSTVVRDIRDHYWDPALNRVPLDSLTAAARETIKGATAYSQMNGAIARVVMALNARFFPPSSVSRIDLGWIAAPVGDSVYLTYVAPRNEVPGIGLQRGDRLVAVNGWPIERQRIVDLEYLLKYLQPAAAVQMTVEHRDGSVVTVTVPTIATQGRPFYDLSRLGGGDDWYQLIREAQSADSGWDSRFASPTPKILYWKLRTFAVSTDYIREGVRRARQAETLILDLRGIHGGFISSSTALVDRLVRETQVGDTIYAVHRRDRRDFYQLERVDEDERWNGRLIVLTDGNSMGASEVLADVVQRTGRGQLIGDRTGGDLYISKGYSHFTNEATSVFYGVGVDVAEVTRPDGTQIQGVGVSPDEFVLPTPADLEARRDPVLARALQILGLPYDPDRAATYSSVGDATTRDR